MYAGEAGGGSSADQSSPTGGGGGTGGGGDTPPFVPTGPSDPSVTDPVVSPRDYDDVATRYATVRALYSPALRLPLTNADTGQKNDVAARDDRTVLVVITGFSLSLLAGGYWYLQRVKHERSNA